MWAVMSRKEAFSDLRKVSLSSVIEATVPPNLLCSSALEQVSDYPVNSCVSWHSKQN